MRASRRRLRPAVQTWPKARALGGGCRDKENNILGLRGPHGINRPAIDAGRPHTREKHAIEGGVACQACAIARLPIQTRRQPRHHVHNDKQQRFRLIAEIGLGRRITSELGQRRSGAEINLPTMQDYSIIGAASVTKLYWGWLVVAVACLVGMLGFGLCFYGPGADSRARRPLIPE